jgi:hypothetical protein
MHLSKVSRFCECEAALGSQYAEGNIFVPIRFSFFLRKIPMRQKKNIVVVAISKVKTLKKQKSLFDDALFAGSTDQE